MERIAQSNLARARDLTRLSARWLVLLRFRANAAAPVFSPSVSHYHAMLDPCATDVAKLDACRKMQILVLRQVQVEQLEGHAVYAVARPIDPYCAHWVTTERGAALAAITSLLERAIILYCSAEGQMAM